MKKYFREIWQQLRRPSPLEHELVWEKRIGLGCPECGSVQDDLGNLPVWYRRCKDCGYQEPEQSHEPVQMRTQDDWLKQFPEAEIYSYDSMPRRRLDREGRLFVS